MDTTGLTQSVKAERAQLLEQAHGISQQQHHLALQAAPVRKRIEELDVALATLNALTNQTENQTNQEKI